MSMNVNLLAVDVINTLINSTKRKWIELKAFATGALLTSAVIPTYTTKIEDTGTYTYVGQAVPGTATSSASWRIYRMTNSTGDIYFDSGEFDEVWDDRASGTYA